MPTIVHFEVPADNIERATKFYNSLFGWKAEKAPGPMEYWMFRTSSGGNADSSTSGGGGREQVIGGGIMPRQQPQQGITNYIGVDSVTEYSKKIEKLGGKVKVPKTEVQGFGWFAICMDTENNTFAIWESNPEAQMNRH